jgi:hypothetical protein
MTSAISHHDVLVSCCLVNATTESGIQVSFPSRSNKSLALQFPLSPARLSFSAEDSAHLQMVTLASCMQKLRDVSVLQAVLGPHWRDKVSHGTQESSRVGGCQILSTSLRHKKRVCGTVRAHPLPASHQERGSVAR